MPLHTFCIACRGRERRGRAEGKTLHITSCITEQDEGRQEEVKKRRRGVKKKKMFVPFLTFCQHVRRRENRKDEGRDFLTIPSCISD